MAQVLTGSRAQAVLERGLDRIPTYGRLASLSLDEVKDLLGALADAGLLERRGVDGGRPGLFVLGLSRTGAAVMRGEERPELALPERPLPTPRRTEARSGSAASAAEVDAALLDRLRAWRRREAESRHVPAYIVFHDRVLESIASARPRSRDELAGIRGLGPAKLDAYGTAILDLVARD